ncbi:MAG: hypothetical protein ACTH8P_00470 [Ewingella sp.]|uniref:hypothetical protein n=1 Tax=Ewingella TaxID=41201 RepID=UPI0033657DAD
MTPNEWFETKGSKPEIREPPKRRHFATITMAAETRSFQPCAASISQQKKRRVPREARLRLPWSVWADAHDLEFEFEFEFKDAIEKGESGIKRRNVYPTPPFTGQ